MFDPDHSADLTPEGFAPAPIPKRSPRSRSHSNSLTRAPSANWVATSQVTCCFPAPRLNARSGASSPIRRVVSHRLQSAETGLSTVIQATGSTQLGSRYPIRAAVRVLQPGGLVIASRYRRRAELAKHDIRRSTIRRSRDDMRRCTIRLPREPASEVAKFASSLRRLEPPACAARCALVFG